MTQKRSSCLQLFFTAAVLNNSGISQEALVAEAHMFSEVSFKTSICNKFIFLKNTTELLTKWHLTFSYYSVSREVKTPPFLKIQPPPPHPHFQGKICM